MSKIINLSVDNCITCPYCKFESDKAVFEKSDYNCTVAQELINGGKPIGTKTPIPKWCPLPDGNEMKYFVVKEALEEVSDDYAIMVKFINAVKLGDEKYIIGTWERDAGFELVDDLNYVAEGKNGWTPRETRPHKVAVILGRLVTEKEVDLSST